MIYWDEITLMFILINFIVVIWIVSGYYFYKNYYLPRLETAEPEFAEGLGELFDNLTKSISESVNKVKVDFDLKEVSDKLTEQFFGTFLAILGVSEEYDENWSFKQYITQIIESSVEKIVPDTIKEFEKILPEFTESFVEAIQSALMGGVAPTVDTPGDNPIQSQVMPNMPELDIGKMLQMYLMQYLVKQMGAGGLGSLMGGFSGGGSPTPRGSSGF